jgi:hypothetical protein
MPTRARWTGSISSTRPFDRWIEQNQQGTVLEEIEAAVESWQTGQLIKL